MKQDTAHKKHTITLTDDRPVIIISLHWPVMASVSHDTDDNNQEIFRRTYLRVRQHDTGAGIVGDETVLTPHADGRCIVYGWTESSYQGEHGSQAGYRCQIEDVVEGIRRVGDRIGAEQWIVDQCIAALPATSEEN